MDKEKLADWFKDVDEQLAEQDRLNEEMGEFVKWAGEITTRQELDEEDYKLRTAPDVEGKDL